MNLKLLTLVLIHENDKVLLGLKKRGFGVGLWNGFGGKVHEGETIEDAAKRELLEESGLTVNTMEKIGVIDFSWKNKEGEVLQVHYFASSNFSGTLIETEEMQPKWFLLNDVPFEKMWADDKYWFPLFLENKKFKGKFIFNDDNSVFSYELNKINKA
jgi:8-oxo-dGTP diphosphatase/2-hydroxy-dATP diphosphatase